LKAYAVFNYKVIYDNGFAHLTHIAIDIVSNSKSGAHINNLEYSACTNETHLWI